MEELDGILRRFRVWNQHLEKLCHQIGERELAFKPMPESNSAAWLLLHMIDGYREFIELAGAERSGRLLEELPRPGEVELSRMPFSEIFTLLDSHRRLFLQEVEKLDKGGRLAQCCPAGEGKTWIDLIHTLLNHEVYHCGQLAYIAKVMQQKARRSPGD